MTVVASWLQQNSFTGSDIHPVTQFTRQMSYEPLDRRMSSANEGLHAPAALMLRRLPLATTKEAVRTMLLFAKDLRDTEIVPADYEEDQGFATAIARFSTMTAASEARVMLDGKPYTAGQANMIVELLPSPTFNPGFRRNTIDPAATRPMTHATSPLGRSLRYNGPFDSKSNLSPPPATSLPEVALSDTTGSFSSMFHSTSPRSSYMLDRARMSGKSVIGESSAEDETDGLLSDPLGYMKKDNPAANGRRTNEPRPLFGAFNALSLNTSMSGSPQHSYLTPRSAIQVHSPLTPFSPATGPYTPANPYLRHNYPPVNPADQNPPCNTLYVGNLPMDTSEDELKAMFSKQRGYKRLCFRTKQNGPMCFVEFEDVSCATRALNELYGAQLHNSVKGGIRLSFSKNPLGVRSGQIGGNTGPTTPLSSSSPNLVSGISATSPSSFSTASGPPPGLSVPSRFTSNGTNLTTQYVGLGMRSPQPGPGVDGIMFSDYMMGR